MRWYITAASGSTSAEHCWRWCSWRGKGRWQTGEEFAKDTAPLVVVSKEESETGEGGKWEGGIEGGREQGQL